MHDSTFPAYRVNDPMTKAGQIHGSLRTVSLRGGWFAMLVLIGLCLPPIRPAVAQDNDFFGGNSSLSRFQYRRDNRAVMRLIESLSQRIGPSVVSIRCGSKPVALGMIVDAEGYVLTKRSQLNGDPIRVQLASNALVPARVVAVRRAADLALLKIETNQKLIPLKFSQTACEVGQLLISSGRSGSVVNIGFVGTTPHKVANSARLGVYLVSQRGTGRALVSNLVPESGADRAGLKRGDVIVAIDGSERANDAEVTQTLRGYYAGEE
ncbi:MAG: trypsin-like peptidase domain-containing protein, partial [Planctomycetota bacterium]